MSEIADIFREMRKQSQAKRERNLTYSTAKIHDFCYQNNLVVESKNNGIHLIIKSDPIIDYWPSTGLWIVRNGQRKRGIKNLIKYLEKDLKKCRT